MKWLQSSKIIRYLCVYHCMRSLVSQIHLSSLETPSLNVFKIVLSFLIMQAVGESCALPLKYYGNNVTGSANLMEVSILCTITLRTLLIFTTFPCKFWLQSILLDSHVSSLCCLNFLFHRAPFAISISGFESKAFTQGNSKNDEIGFNSVQKMLNISLHYKEVPQLHKTYICITSH